MKILVIGDSCIDEFVYGSTRMNPEAPTPILKPVRTTNNPGMAANVFENIKAVKGPNDTVELLTQTETIIKRRFIDEVSNYIMMRVDEEDPTIKPLDNPGNGISPKMQIKDYDMVVISDYNKGFLTTNIIQAISRQAKLTFLDTKKPLGSWCDDIDFIKINELEYNNPAHQEDGLLISLQDKLIVTLGSRGARYKGVVYPVESIDARDVVGAGDTFIAAFSVAYWHHRYGWHCDLSQQYSVEKAMEFANKCSAQVVTKKGVALPDPSKLKMDSPFKESK